jgi:hypothetical protein
MNIKIRESASPIFAATSREKKEDWEVDSDKILLRADRKADGGGTFLQEF